jgi:hypothetical protein
MVHGYVFSDIHSHPFYKPLWRRVAIVASLAAWTGFEIYNGSSPFWFMIFGALTIFCFWTMFVTYPKDT